MNESCKDIVDLIPLYIDNVLEDDINSKVQKHLKYCKDCNQEFLFLSKISKSFQEIPDVRISENFHKNLMTKAAEQQAKKRARRIVLLRRSGAGVAAAAVVALSVVSFGNLGNTNSDISNQAPVYSATPAPEVSPDAITKTTTNAHREVTTPPQKETEEAKQTLNLPQEVVEAPASTGGGSSAQTPVSEATVPVDATAVCDDSAYMSAEITLDDTNRDAVMEILSPYEKDEIGYRVPDINKVMRKIAELGIEITAESCEFSQNYIIVK